MGYQRNQISRFHRETLKMESHELSSRIILKTQNHAENTLFQWGPPIFPKIPGIKFLYARGKKHFYIDWPERHNLGPDRHFEQNYRPGKPLGYISGCIYIQYQIICIHFSLVLFIVSQLICIQSHLVFTQAELIYVQSSFKYLFMLYVFSSQFFFVNMSNVLCVTLRILLKFVLFEKNKRNNCMSYSNFL